jgi:hypothetical protein
MFTIEALLTGFSRLKSGKVYEKCDCDDPW